MSQSVSAILILEVEQRYFALTFGHGRAGLATDYVDRDFGLRVALNSVEIDQIKAIQTRTVERNSLHQSRMATEAGHLAALGVELEKEWVRSIEGKGAGDLGAIAGSQAVNLKWDGDIKGLVPRLANLLRLSQSVDYRKRFPGIDQIRPVERGSDVEHDLNELLRQEVRLGNTERVALSYRRTCGWQSPAIAHYRVFKGHTRQEFPDLSLHNVRVLLTRLPLADPFRVKIMSFDVNGEEGPRLSLYECLTAAFPFNGEDYVFLEGRWFRVTAELLQRIQDRLNVVPDITDFLKLPTWNAREREGSRSLLDNPSRLPPSTSDWTWTEPARSSGGSIPK